MENIINHSVLNMKDDKGNEQLIYPQNDGTDVSLDASTNKSIPENVSNVQELVNKMGGAAFMDSSEITTLQDDVSTLQTQTKGIIVTVPSTGWSQSGNLYTQSVYIEGLSGNETLSASLYDDGNLTDTEITLFDEVINKIEVRENHVVFTAFKKPAVTILVSLIGIVNVNFEGFTNLSDLRTNISNIEGSIGTSDISNIGDGKITGAISTVNSTANTNKTNISSLNSNVESLTNTVNSLNSNINTVNTKIGTSDISNIGDGKITGAISTVNSNINTVNTKIGTTDISNIGDGKITGAISTVNSTANTNKTNISSLNSNVESLTNTVNSLNSNVITKNTIGSQSVKYASSAGSASSASTASKATNADYATNAGYATSAGSASSASTAANATNANYATSAGSASSATYASYHPANGGVLIRSDTSSKNRIYVIRPSDDWSYMHCNCTSNAGNEWTYGLTWWQSDERLKKNIQETTKSGLTFVDAIEHKEFDWDNEKTPNTGHVSIGYIAQQILKLDPDCITIVPQAESSGFDELYQINDTHIIPYLSKAIQELHSLIKEQQSEIEKLKLEIKTSK